MPWMVPNVTRFFKGVATIAKTKVPRVKMN